MSVQSIVGRPAFAKTAAPVAAATPAAAAAPQVAPPVPQAPGESASRGNRGLWIASGALAAVIAVVLVIQFGPWKRTSAEALPQAQQEAPAQEQTQAPPAEAPPAPATPAEPAPATPAEPTPVPPPPPAVGRRPAPRPAGAAIAQPAPPPKSAPAAEAPAAQPPAPAAPAPAVPRPSPAELQAIRERLVKVQSRAVAARASLDALRSSQAASGLGLRGDMVEAAALLASYLEGGRSALTAGDADSAKDLTEKSERQLERIENFLGR